MLIEFRVENHRSIREEQVLSFEAASIDHPEGVTRTVEGYDKPLLRVMAVYGANGSGKSNVLRALAFMCQAVFHSQRLWAPAGGVPRDPFAWGPWREAPSLYEATVVRHGVRYQYGFVVDDEQVLEEWLYAWPKGHKQTWFERDADAIKFGRNFRGERQVLEETLRPNALLLSLAAQLNHQQTRDLFGWFARADIVGDDGNWVRTRAVTEMYGADQHADFSYFFEKFMRLADLGIRDCEVREGPGGKQLWFRHAEHPDAWLPLEQQSRGTKALVDMVLPIGGAMSAGDLLLVDELDNSFHSGLARSLVGIADDIGGQLLFSTHDATMLGSVAGEPALARDQVWLTEKSPEGATTLTPLTDFRPRKAENLMRGYLQGRYGGVPHIQGLGEAVQSEAK